MWITSDLSPPFVLCAKKCGFLTLLHCFKCKQRIVHHPQYILHKNNTRKHREMWFLAGNCVPRQCVCAWVYTSVAARAHSKARIFPRVQWIWNWVRGGLQGRWLRIQAQNSEIQNGGFNMADENAKNNLIGTIFATRRFSGSLITNSRSKFRNS